MKSAGVKDKTMLFSIIFIILLGLVFTIYMNFFGRVEEGPITKIETTISE